MIFLQGCGGVYSSKFNCPDAKGLQCKSLSDVNNSINNNTIDIEIEGKCKAGRKCNSTKDKNVISNNTSQEIPANSQIETFKIWLASQNTNSGVLLEREAKVIIINKLD
jgi:hypothetical protein